MVGLHRPWDLRGYSGDALALLTERTRAYGSRHLERFLAWLGRVGAAEQFTDALARWTMQCWQSAANAPTPAYYYIDGHRKPVFSDARIPRGLIGRTGAITGCRALVLLHDAHGHPLLVTTHRGDQHLTIGLPQILARYAAATGGVPLTHIVVDREGMGGDFLAGLVRAGCTVVTILRSDQYHGLTSFSAVGEFVPLQWDRHGTVVREVAPARFALRIPSRPGEDLPLSVALIRDHRRQVPDPTAAAPHDAHNLPPYLRWLTGTDADHPEARSWRDWDWVATPLPAAPTQAKLIPIVTTASCADAPTLAHMYSARWPQQENSIRDFLIPLGIDTNHGYAKTAVENAEVAKQRAALEQQRDRLQRWTASARIRSSRAAVRAYRADQRQHDRRVALGKELLQQHMALLEQGGNAITIRTAIRARRAEHATELDGLMARFWQAERQQDAEQQKVERYCQRQRVVLRKLDDLQAREQQMYELNNETDQVMSVCKVALANLAMWTRDQYFPPTYARATWQRLAPFFRLPGWVTWEETTVRVELRAFNDRQLTRDLQALCERVQAQAPRLPDGRRLICSVAPPQARNSELHQRR